MFQSQKSRPCDTYFVQMSSPCGLQNDVYAGNGALARLALAKFPFFTFFFTRIGLMVAISALRWVNQLLQLRSRT